MYKKAELTPKVLSEIQVQETFRTSHTHDQRRVLPDILCYGGYAVQGGTSIFKGKYTRLTTDCLEELHARRLWNGCT